MNNNLIPTNLLHRLQSLPNLPQPPLMNPIRQPPHQPRLNSPRNLPPNPRRTLHMSLRTRINPPSTNPGILLEDLLRDPERGNDVPAKGTKGRCGEEIRVLCPDGVEGVL
jgi:hypothetical protein